MSSFYEPSYVSIPAGFNKRIYRKIIGATVIPKQKINQAYTYTVKGKSRFGYNLYENGIFTGLISYYKLRKYYV